MEKILKLIKSLTEQNFYGTIELRFEEGKIVFVKKTETIKV